MLGRLARRAAGRQNLIEPLLIELLARLRLLRRLLPGRYRQGIHWLAGKWVSVLVDHRLEAQFVRVEIFLVA